MTNNLPLLKQDHHDDDKALAPVVPFRKIGKDNIEESKRLLEIAKQDKTTLIYTEPIYRSKKYDLF